MWRKGNSCVLLVISWLGPFRKQYRVSSKKLRIEHMIQQSQFWEYIRTKGKQDQRGVYASVLAVLFTLAKVWKQPK